MPKSTVYFIKDITPENIVKIYKKLGKELTGKVAVKVHSGEKGNQNYLHPEFMRPIVEHVHGTIVECNTSSSKPWLTPLRPSLHILTATWLSSTSCAICPSIAIAVPSPKILA